MTGLWFNDQGYLADHNLGLVYDAYILFGPNAEWDSKPAPIVGEGYTVIGTSEQLRAEIQQLLSE